MFVKLAVRFCYLSLQKFASPVPFSCAVSVVTWGWNSPREKPEPWKWGPGVGGSTVGDPWWICDVMCGEWINLSVEFWLCQTSVCLPILIFELSNLLLGWWKLYFRVGVYGRIIWKNVKEFERWEVPDTAWSVEVGDQIDSVLRLCRWSVYTEMRLPQGTCQGRCRQNCLVSLSGLCCCLVLSDMNQLHTSWTSWLCDHLVGNKTQLKQKISKEIWFWGLLPSISEIASPSA